MTRFQPRSRHFSTLNISETTRDRAIVTVERQWEVVCALSHGDISSDLDGPLTQFSRLWPVCRSGAWPPQTSANVVSGRRWSTS